MAMVNLKDLVLLRQVVETMVHRKAAVHLFQDLHQVDNKARVQDLHQIHHKVRLQRVSKMDN